MINYGFVKSITFGVPVLDPNGQSNIPETFDISEQMPSVVNQGEKGICVSVCVTDMIRYLYLTLGKKPYKKKNDFFYNHRSDKSQEGMAARNAFEIAKANGLIQSYAILRNATAIKLSIIAHGPVLVALPVYSPKRENFWDKEESEQVVAYHAVTFVGYTPESFILRNSWGTDWGIDGYTNFPIDKTNLLVEAWTIFK